MRALQLFFNQRLSYVIVAAREVSKEVIIATFIHEALLAWVLHRRVLFDRLDVVLPRSQLVTLALYVKLVVLKQCARL